MSDRDNLMYLRDMLDSIVAIESFMVGIDRNGFAGDRKTFSATVRELEIIGEAAGRVSDEVRLQYPFIAWRMLKDFRNVLAHHYFGVDVEIVWDVVQRKLPELKGQLLDILQRGS